MTRVFVLSKILFLSGVMASNLMAAEPDLEHLINEADQIIFGKFERGEVQDDWLELSFSGWALKAAPYTGKLERYKAFVKPDNEQAWSLVENKKAVYLLKDMDRNGLPTSSIFRAPLKERKIHDVLKITGIPLAADVREVEISEAYFKTAEGRIDLTVKAKYDNSCFAPEFGDLIRVVEWPDHEEPNVARVRLLEQQRICFSMFDPVTVKLQAGSLSPRYDRVFINGTEALPRPSDVRQIREK